VLRPESLTSHARSQSQRLALLSWLPALGNQPHAVTAATGGDVTPRILLIEDDEDDLLLTRELLAEAFGDAFELEWARSWDQALAAIGEARHDIYLVDYRLGARNGLELVREAIDLGSAAPFIVLTGQGSREIDLEAMRAGAADYLAKGEMTAPLLDRAIRYAIERHRSERRLAEMAQFDQLTGLANRVLLRDYLIKTLARADRHHQLVAVMLLDLDRFKTINDTHGHNAGDQLLKEVADRLRLSVRQSDLVARLGGDEFTVVMDGLTDPGVIAGLAARILEVVRQPVHLDRCEVFTSASIGISVYPTDVDNIDDLLTSADAAMYRAKERGAGRFHFYTVAMRVRAAERLELENGLRSALLRREFRLHYQPQVDLRTGAIVGMEALLRWQHPRRGLVAPAEFVPLAEETGLIVPIGAWVLRSACGQLSTWHRAGYPAVRMAVNFSARQFQDEDIAVVVAAILEQCDLAPRFLEIEITESDILKGPSRVQTLLKEFTDLGVRVALDDFGTGYSSLNHLRSFPGASIKIDQSFVQNVCSERHDAAIVRSLISMAHNLSLKVIAEGVETAEQLAFLRENDCDAIQGYLVRRPMPAEEIGREIFIRPLIPHLHRPSLTA
jgi:diguanylate cyclase (GGDEF)-like protein